MIIRKLIPMLACCGLLFAIFFSFTYGKPAPVIANQLSMPPSSPFKDAVSGIGIIEASSRNIEVGSHLPGIVAEVMVSEGDLVKQGDVLVKLDDSINIADRDAKAKQVSAAASRLENAKIALDDEKEQLSRYNKMSEEAISRNDVERRRFATKKATSSVNTAKAEYESAIAELKLAEATLEQMTIKAPIDARILKVRVQKGQYINAGSNIAPILLGNDNPLHLRVTIDENDVWRFNPDMKAKAALRSNKDIAVDLRLVRIEPYVQPKRNLSGDTSERVDTRVLEVIYAIESSPKRLYIGEQMDVFIEK